MDFEYKKEFYNLKSLGSFAAPAASDFLAGQKVTKEPLGGRANRISAAEPPHSPCALPPRTPVLRGAPIRRAWRLSQRRGWFS